MTDELNEGTAITLPIEWVVDENTPSGYVTNLVVQHTEHEFIISFFELKPPVLLGSPEEKQEQAERLGNLKARCVAQVTIPASRMPQVLEAINGNYQNYLSKLSNHEED